MLGSPELIEKGLKNVKVLHELQIYFLDVLAYILSNLNRLECYIFHTFVRFKKTFRLRLTYKSFALSLLMDYQP